MTAWSACASSFVRLHMSHSHAHKAVASLTDDSSEGSLADAYPMVY